MEPASKADDGELRGLHLRKPGNNFHKLNQ